MLVYFNSWPSETCLKDRPMLLLPCLKRTPRLGRLFLIFTEFNLPLILLTLSLEPSRFSFPNKNVSHRRLLSCLLMSCKTREIDLSQSQLTRGEEVFQSAARCHEGTANFKKIKNSDWTMGDKKMTKPCNHSQFMWYNNSENAAHRHLKRKQLSFFNRRPKKLLDKLFRNLDR